MFLQEYYLKLAHPICLHLLATVIKKYTHTTNQAMQFRSYLWGQKLYENVCANRAYLLDLK